MMMPNKTIYVSDTDLPIFERAQELAGDTLSSTIVQALRRFVQTHEAKMRGFREVTVRVGKNTYTHKRFRGRLVGKTHVEHGEDGSHDIIEVYQTAKDRIALYIRRLPHWWFTGRGGPLGNNPFGGFNRRDPRKRHDHNPEEQTGPFGPEGPFGANGPFGPYGPFGGRGQRKRHDQDPEEQIEHLRGAWRHWDHMDRWDRNDRWDRWDRWMDFAGWMGQGQPGREHGEDWHVEFVLEVYDTLDEVKGHIPDDLYLAVEQAIKGDSVETLDI